MSTKETIPNILTDLDGTLTHPENHSIYVDKSLDIRYIISKDFYEFAKKSINLLFNDFNTIMITKNKEVNALYFLNWAEVDLPPEILSTFSFGIELLNPLSDEATQIKINNYADIIKKKPEEKFYVLEDSRTVLFSVLLMFPKQVIPIDCSRDNWFIGQLAKFIGSSNAKNINTEMIDKFLIEMKENFEKGVKIAWLRLRKILDDYKLNFKVERSYIYVYNKLEKIFRVSLDTLEIFKPNGKKSIINLLKEDSSDELIKILPI